MSTPEGKADVPRELGHFRFWTPSGLIGVAATTLCVLAENDRTLTFGTPVDGTSV